MKPRGLVTEVDQAIENIRAFDRNAHSNIRDMIAYVRHWYAARDLEGRWMFAPAKFIGYAGKTVEAFAATALDGRAAENNLKRWFVELEKASKLEQTLMVHLRQATARHGKSLNSLARIHVLMGEGAAVSPGARPPLSESWRITSDPEILSGKPCIRGIRIRVGDILEMLAQGAARVEILEDFPYLEDADITAVLEFAMGAVDHRLVKAA